MNKGFRSLADRIVNFFFEMSPFAATTAGLHQYDHLLDRCEADVRASHRAALKEALRDLKAYENAHLTTMEQMDLAVLQGQIQTRLRFEEDLKPYERNPGIYLEGLMGALFHMVVRDYAPPAVRGRAMLERLKGVPAYIEVATQNLKRGYDIPRLWVEIAIESLEGADRFFRESIQPFAEACTPIREELSDAAEGARRVLLRFRSFLADMLVPRCDGSFAVGRDFFEFLIEKAHGLHLKAKDLIAIGEEAIASTQAELERTAAEIAPGKPWTRIVADLKRQHPPPQKLTQAYRKEIERSREAVVNNDLVTLPEHDKLTLMETPPYLRPLLPYAAYMPPGPFEAGQEGFFFVTPIDRDAPREHQEAQLEGHNTLGIALTALHEGYPGHHLQLLLSNRASSRARKVSYTSTFAEGWALYCEELMWEHGFFDLRGRLLQLKDLLWRACRVLLDVKLHLSQMTFDEAVDMLVNVARLERPNAIAEVKRYSLEPTQPMSYLVGMREIKALREDFRQQRGERFKLREFHDKLLSFGTVPIPLVREAMLR